MPEWKTKSSEVVYETNWMRVRRDQVVNHNGKEITYSYVEEPAVSIVIVAVDIEGDIFLQKQYRYPIRRALWELPAGGSDGEDPLVAAKRELKEETGLVSEQWLDIGGFYALDGMVNSPFRVFLARDVKQGVGPTDEEEDIIDRKFFSPQELSERIKHNEILNCETIAALSIAMLKLRYLG